MEYTWHPPKVSDGDRVLVEDHSRNNIPGALREGIVQSIMTRYDHNGGAYHSYAVLIDGWRIRRHVGDERILRVIEHSHED